MSSFFETATNGKNSLWRYFVMFVAAFLAANIIGGAPLLIVIIVKGMQNPELLDKTASNFVDFSIYGIDPVTGFILMMIPFIIGLLTIFLLFKPMHRRRFITVFNGSSGIRWGRIFTGMLVWLLLMSIYMYASLRTNPSNFELNNTSNSLWFLAIAALLLVPFQTSFEEILFRGYLMQGFGALSGNRWVPLITTSLFFALMHAFNPEIKEFGFFTMMPQYLLYGFLFGLITILDNGIELAVGAHLMNNLFLSVFLTQESSALLTPALYKQFDVYPWSDFIGLLGMSVVFLIVLWMIFRWNPKDINWRKI